MTNTKLKTSSLSLLLTLSIGFATNINANDLSTSFLININTLSSSLQDTKQVANAKTISPDSDKGKLIGAFTAQYKNVLSNNTNSVGSQNPFLPKGMNNLNQRKKNAFGQGQINNSAPKLNQKLITAPSLTLKMDAKGTPSFIKGIQKEALSPYSSIRFSPDKQTIETKNLSFFEKYSQVLRLDSPSSELKVSKLFQDEDGQFHTRYKQSYNGVPIWGAELITHSNQLGDVLSMDGKYIPSPSNISTTPDISLDDATILAITSQLPSTDSRSVDSTGRLVIYSDNDSLKPVLAWEIKLNISIAHQYVVLVNAKTSNVIFSYNNIQTENVSGRGVDLKGQSRNLNVWQFNGTYYLHDASKSMFVSGTSPLDQDNNAKGFISVVDARNEPSNNEIDRVPDRYHIVSSSPNSGWLDEGVGASYNLSKTFDYFKEKHNRNSLDGEGGTINAVVRVGNNYNNAFWHSGVNMMFFGNGDTFTSSLDVVAHELTHGVTSSESNLVYQGQSGAINESLSDIFGEVIENYSTGSNDWLIGSQLKEVYRSLKDPGSIDSGLGRPYPSKMSEYENLALTPEADNGGVHINSSIINKAFYLLAEGQSNAIGLDNAAKIFYRANTNHLLPRSDFSGLRQACLQSAEEIYGSNSSQVSAVASAFDAVEIYDSPTTPTPTPGTASSSDDSVIMLFTENDNIYTGRYEKALNDPDQGVSLSDTTAYGQRPAVSGNGEVAAFITADNDLCLVETSTGDESCLGSPGSYYSVAFSPDDRYISIILTDSSTGAGSSSVIIIDMSTDPSTSIEYELVAAPVNGSSNNQITFADAMDFNATGRYLVYDALNEISFSDSQDTAQVWSIYALDLTDGTTLDLVPPQTNANVGNPSLSNINSSLMTFDIYNNETDINTVAVADLSTGEVTGIAETNTYAVPSLTGDDASVVYSLSDSSTTGYSLHAKPLSGGSSSLWMQNAYAGVIYRRGNITAPANVDLQVSQSVSGSSKLNDTVTFTVTIKNNGPDDASNITLTNNFTTGLQVSSKPSNCDSGSDTNITCSISSLGSGNSSSITLKFKATKSGVMTNSSQVQAFEGDSNATNNGSYESIEISTDSGTTSTSSGGGSLSIISLLLLSLFQLSSRNRRKRIASP